MLKTTHFTYKNIIFLYILFFAVMTFQFWFNGDVIAPHQQHKEFGLTDISGSKEVESNTFRDISMFYVPEVYSQMNGLRSGWLTLWTNQNELGRPMTHGGLSSAYLLSQVFFQLIDDPWFFCTVFSFFFCFSSGIFIILFCKELAFTPLTAFITGVSFAFSPLFMFWITQPMLIATWCWAAGVLWGITRLARKTDLLGFSSLAFSVYSLLLTGYPQITVYYIYMFAGYVFYFVYKKWKKNYKESILFLSLIISSCLIAGIMVLPVYQDIVVAYGESARVSPSITFFINVFPEITDFNQVLHFIAFNTVPKLFVDPISSDFFYNYRGTMFSLLTIFFASLGLLVNFKKIWGWGLAVAIPFLLFFMPSVFIFAIKYMGFNLSKINPLMSTILPVIVCMAFGLETALQTDRAKKLSYFWNITVGFIILIVITVLFYALTQDKGINFLYLSGLVFLIMLLSIQYKKVQPVLLLSCLIIVLAITAFPLVLCQSPKNIVKTSPLIEKMQENIPITSRYAIVNSKLRHILLPNMNVIVNLPSIHSYNSLSSNRYHALIKELGGKIYTFGRINYDILPDYFSTTFWMSNIGLILSESRIEHENLEYIDEETGIYLHKVKSVMGESLQIVLSELERKQFEQIKEKISISDPRMSVSAVPDKKKDLGDLLEFEVKIEQECTLFLLSQKYHRDWEASVFINQAWQPAGTVEVNSIFQGVILPAKSQKVRLEFKPFVRFAWIVHVFWVLLFLILSGMGYHGLCRNMWWKNWGRFYVFKEK